MGILNLARFNLLYKFEQHVKFKIRFKKGPNDKSALLWLSYQFLTTKWQFIVTFNSPLPQTAITFYSMNFYCFIRPAESIADGPEVQKWSEN